MLRLAIKFDTRPAVLSDNITPEIQGLIYDGLWIELYVNERQSLVVWCWGFESCICRGTRIVELGEISATFCRTERIVYVICQFDYLYML